MAEKSGGNAKPKRLSSDAQAVFCRQLAFVVRAGIPLSGAHDFLRTEAEDPEEAALVGEVFREVGAAGGFAQALARTGRFSEYLCAMVLLGEKTGSLEQSLYDLADYFEQRADIRRKVTQAFTYPLILLAMMLAVILFLIIEVLPQFAEILSSAGGTLPAAAAGLLGFGLWVRRSWIFLLAAVLLLAAAGVTGLRSAPGRRLLDRLSLTRAGFGATTRKLATARFCAAMRMALTCGNGFTESVELTAGVIGNSEVRRRLLLLGARVRQGGDIPASLGESGLFPRSFVSLFATAYRTGNLEETLGRMSAYYQESFDDAVYGITSRIEPGLVIALSCVAGIILFSVMLPIINIMQLIG